MHRLASHLHGKTDVIWDWNGTLLDDVALCVEIIRDIAIEHGVDPLDHEAYLRIFRFPVIDYYRDAGFDLERFPFADLSRKFMGAYIPRARHSALFNGARALLADLKAQGVRSSVLSATREPDLHEMLDHHRLSHAFAHICGIADEFAVSKVARGLQLMQLLDVDCSQVVMIGDTDHDLEVGQAMGIDVILVDGGHQHFDKLSARHSRVVTRLRS